MVKENVLFDILAMIGSSIYECFRGKLNLEHWNRIGLVWRIVLNIECVIACNRCGGCLLPFI